MTADDAKIIFSNVSELAIFADLFTEELEVALGDVVDGGQGEDHVGALFLRIVRISILTCETCDRSCWARTDTRFGKAVQALYHPPPYCTAAPAGATADAGAPGVSELYADGGIDGLACMGPLVAPDQTRAAPAQVSFIASGNQRRDA